MSFKAFMTFKNENPKSNGLAFATRVEAEAYAKGLCSRWIVPIGYEIRESDEPVNYRWNFDTHSTETVRPGLSEYELKVLRAVADGSLADIARGAAFNQAMEVLVSSGYVFSTARDTLTDKGLALMLEQNNG